MMLTAGGGAAGSGDDPASRNVGSRVASTTSHAVPSGTDELLAVAEGTKVRIFDFDSFLGKECNHIRTVRPVRDDFEINLETAACSTCGSTAETWLCLVCHSLLCGRHHNSHMLQHFNETGHCVTMNLVDLSVWCYGCDMYLQHEFFPRLHKFFTRLHQLKHHESPPNLRPFSSREGIASHAGAAVEGGLLLPPEDFTVCSDAQKVGDAYQSLRSMSTSCATCRVNNVTENVALHNREDWICLHCGGVFCGRYHHKHGLHHFQLTGHALALSLVDVSIWCYNCMSYVDHNVTPALQAAYNYVFRLRQEQPNFAPLALQPSYHS